MQAHVTSLTIRNRGSRVEGDGYGHVAEIGRCMLDNDEMFGKRDEGARPDSRSVGGLANVSARPGARAQAPTQPDPERAPVSVEDHRGSKLVVGPNIKMKGVEVTDCDTLVVEGDIEASLDSRVVQIKESGLFKGSAGMDIAEIWGSFEGDLTARKQLIIHPTGRVSGYIRYAQIKVEEGGEISGEVSTLAEAPERKTAAAPSRPGAVQSSAAVSKPRSRSGART